MTGSVVRQPFSPKREVEVFGDELLKLAVPAWWSGLKAVGQRAGGMAGSGFALGGVGGAGIGGAAGAAKGYREARERGATAAQAGLGGLGGLLMGATKGAVTGAALGTLGGGAAGAAKLTPGLARTLAATKGPVGAVSRFGQRQAHGVTGWTPKGGLGSIRGGAWEATKGKERAAKALSDIQARRGAAAKLKPTARARAEQKAQKALGKARGAEESSLAAESMGLTSLPGYVRAIGREGPVKAIGTGMKQQWRSQGTLGRAVTFGLPAATIAGEAAKSTEPGGPGRLQRMGEAAGTLAYGMGPLPIAGTLLAAPAIGTALGSAGKVGDILGKKVRKKQPPAPAQTVLEPGNVSQSSEKEYSDRAMGQPTEDIHQ